MVRGWKRAHISAHLVLSLAAKPNKACYPLDGTLAKMTGAPLAVVWAALERESARGNIDCGLSLRGAWITEKGRTALALTQR